MRHACSFLLSLAVLSCSGPDYRERPRTNASNITESPLPASTARLDPFATTPAFASAPPTMRATKMHSDGKVGVVPGKAVKCMGCHGAANDGDGQPAPKFQFGGSASADQAGTTPAPDVEIGVVDSNGEAFFAHTDEDGNFWVLGQKPITYPAFAAVRDASGKKAMKKKINSADEIDCNSCHDGTNPIQKPPSQ